MRPDAPTRDSLSPTERAGGFGSRRDFLSWTTAGLGSVAIASLLGKRAVAANDEPIDAPPHYPPRASRVIQIFLAGGLSHVDSFDYKQALDKRHGQPMPVAERPDVFFGKVGLLCRPFWEFRRRGQSGLWVSELFPHVAEVADELTVIRSMVAQTGNHTPAEFQATSGFRRSGFPAMGSWVSYGLGSEAEDLPAFVVLPDARGLPAGGSAHWSSGFLPAHTQGVPFRLEGPAVRDLSPSRAIPPATESASRALLERMNRRHLAARAGCDELTARVRSHELAARMQLAVPEVTDVGAETSTTHRLYGLDGAETRAFGRACLLARRLVEKGVRFVQIYSGGEFGTPRINWDGHHDMPKNHSQEAARVDRPIAGLLRDLRSRGLLDETLVVCSTEFGRTPFTESDDGVLGKGRDHNPKGFTVWMAGAGVKRGFAYGATDEFGYEAVENPVRWPDFHATVLRLLGIDHERLTYYHNGIERRLTNVSGHVINDVMDG
jgi:hypothetical protein